ncbi:MAG: LysM peptidoglycan-binding domain-containing protein [Acidobacteriota bacterium]|nr:LysM peptidoglycan-binding domain-containing protein [Acidobacteriota bacterium]
MALRWRRLAVPAACIPLLLLAGCPQQNAGTPAGTSPGLTAPPSSSSGTPAGAAAGASAQAPPQTPEAAAQARRIQQLISRVEGTYRSGVNNYRSGHLDAARADFDSAVDLMLSSGLNLKSDPQLSDEFEHLLSAINTLEMSAIKQGSGFSAPIEAAPLDAADEVTFPANPALTAKVKAELKTTQSDFPLVVNDYVAGFISYFSNSPAGHAHLLRSLERAGKYKEMISRVLREEGVPQDLIYLAVAESGFQPQALNARSGAGGMWQFMPTGAYGLARSGWVDERFDPEKSSRAYARYIKSLYNQFGDWYLAMAAYDWGPGYVQRSVMRTGYADYWELYRRNVLPQETKNYVPGIIAAIIMAKNPKQYGLENLVPDPPVVSDTVRVNYSVDLRLVADLTNASVADIAGLNPSLLRMTTPRDGSFDLHLPPGTTDLYTRRIDEIPLDRRASWRFHVVRAGESLDAIASSFHTRASEIEAANKLASSDSIETGDELVIPAASASSAPHLTHYVTRAGDTLVKVADRFNVSPDDLRRWNHLSSSVLPPHRTLTVSEPVHLAHEAHVRSRGTHGAANTRASKGDGAGKGSAKKTSQNAGRSTTPRTTNAGAGRAGAGKALAGKKKRGSK